MREYSISLQNTLESIYKDKKCRISSKQLLKTVIPTGCYPIYLISAWSNTSIDEAQYYEHIVVSAMVA